MVKVAGPMMSLDASGSLAGALVFSKWKGRNYVRTLVKPANPKSGGQVGIRSMFKFLSQQWTNLSTVQKADWEDRADDNVVSPFNAFMGYNQERWRNYLGPSKTDPAEEAGATGTNANQVATGGVRQISIGFDLTVAGDVWAHVIFRSLTTPMTPAFTNAIAVILTEGVDSYTYVDTPLDPGTYYYNLMTLTDDGNKGGYANDFQGTAT